MKIAVVTPYCREPLEKLRRCHESVRAQDVVSQDITVDHILVGDGYPQRTLDAWPVMHMALPVNCGDSGDTPRLIGAAMVAALAYEALLFLDADNWYEPDHVRTLVALHRASGAAIVTCARALRRPDGTLLGTCRECDGSTFCDFNCYLFARKAFGHLRTLAFSDRAATYFTDRYLYNHIKNSGAAFVHSSRPTVNYETMTISHYVNAGEAPPPGATQTVYFADEKKWRKVASDELDALFARGTLQFSPMLGNTFPDEENRS